MSVSTEYIICMKGLISTWNIAALSVFAVIISCPSGCCGETCVVKSGSGEVSYDVIGIFQGEMLRTLAGDRNGGDEKWLMSTYSINIKA